MTGTIVMSAGAAARLRCPHSAILVHVRVPFEACNCVCSTRAVVHCVLFEPMSSDVLQRAQS
eukprot:6185768-Pleurochrysis_carterae.AAC.4